MLLSFYYMVTIFWSIFWRWSGRVITTRTGKLNKTDYCTLTFTFILKTRTRDLSQDIEMNLVSSKVRNGRFLLRVPLMTGRLSRGLNLYISVRRSLLSQSIRPRLRWIDSTSGSSKYTWTTCWRSKVHWKINSI